MAVSKLLYQTGIALEYISVANQFNKDIFFTSKLYVEMLSQALWLGESLDLVSNSYHLLYESRGGTSDFRLPTSDFRLQASGFRLQSMDHP